MPGPEQGIDYTVELTVKTPVFPEVPLAGRNQTREHSYTFWKFPTASSCTGVPTVALAGPKIADADNVPGFATTWSLTIWAGPALVSMAI